MGTCFAALWAIAPRSWDTTRASRGTETRCGGQTADGVVGGGAVGGADAGKLVGVCGDIRDKLLGGEGEETRQVRWGLAGACAWRWEAGEGEIVSSDCIGNLEMEG